MEQEKRKGPEGRPKPNKKGVLRREAILDVAFRHLQTVGFAEFTVTTVAHDAGVAVRTVYHHFPTRTDLILASLRRHDFWMSLVPNLDRLKELHAGNCYREFSSIVFKRMAYQLYTSPAFREMILLELRGQDPWLVEIIEARDRLGEEFFAITDVHFRDSDTDLRLLSALLLFGLETAIVRSHAFHPSACGVNFLLPETRTRIDRCIDLLMEWAYSQGPSTSEEGKDED